MFTALHQHSSSTFFGSPRPVRALLADDDRMTQRLLPAIFAASGSTSPRPVEIIATVSRFDQLALASFVEGPELLLLDRWLGAEDTLPLAQDFAQRPWAKSIAIIILSADAPAKLPPNCLFLPKREVLTGLAPLVAQTCAAQASTPPPGIEPIHAFRLDGLESQPSLEAAEQELAHFEALLARLASAHLCVRLGGAYFALAPSPNRDPLLEQLQAWCQTRKLGLCRADAAACL